MADGDPGSPWNGGGPFSKRLLLEVAVESGHIMTATFDNGDEAPYYGARFHADELEAEGLLAKHTGPFRVETVADFVIAGTKDCVLWRPTPAGRAAIKGGDATQGREA